MTIRLPLLLLLFLIANTATAQQCDSVFLGTKTLYTQPKNTTVKIPDGYKAVFVNYVGRHGARHLTKAPSSAYVYQLIAKADSAKALTVLGQQLKKMVLALDKVEKGNTKNISTEGVTELMGIASRLYQNNSAVFADRPRVTVTVTKEIRTRQSADAFLKGLQPLLRNQTIIEKGINDTTLRFYDLSPGYLDFEKNGSWIKIVDDLKNYLSIAELNTRVTARFFTADFTKTISAANQSQFVNDFFGFATIVYSLNQEVKQAGFSNHDLSFQSFFTCDELATLSRIDVAEDFFTKGPGADINGIQVKIAAPLLADFLKTTDSFVAGKKIVANLRFSHAETISPFAALLGLNRSDKVGTYIQLINKNWESAKVIPLSANVQWILYKNNTGGYLLRCLLNEKDAAIAGLKPVYPNFYAWPEVKKYYLNKLKSIGAPLSGNMLSYLKTLK
ncbi:histidine-type phosphatase [Mucilaginibacter psychrotolerans]|uniref:Multiple inositol polyphosphate phosphatase 1 n=1 Tax=Mucilaginibacter psychrotolerans TaxID=1524096 RepID=A0A4Y8S8S0_9SPHI|nr:histidine-type phosphatase [Mucilaginibacter psychrotolerans]TFF34834.1 histidine-type phosphatase [Mucilaginibacter psychrotolerans]